MYFYMMFAKLSICVMIFKIYLIVLTGHCQNASINAVCNERFGLCLYVS